MPMSSPTSLLRSAYRQVRGRYRPNPASLERLFFLHVPKCGGTSIDVALRDAYRRAGADVAYLDPHASTRAAEMLGQDMATYRGRLLLYHMAQQPTRYISGHFTYVDAAWEHFGNAWRYVTVLRDPVARWFSNYFYNKYKTKSDHFRIEQPIDEFVETERARSYGFNYVRSLTDGIPVEEAGSDAAIEQAIHNLSHFTVVGVLEHLDTFARDCETVFGIQLPIGHRNKNPRTEIERREEVTDDILGRVQAICAPNAAVYETVRARIDAQGSWLPTDRTRPDLRTT